MKILNKNLRWSFWKEASLLLHSSITKMLKIFQLIPKKKTFAQKLNSLIYLLRLQTLWQLNQLIDISCTDTLKKDYRFELNYILSSLIYNSTITIQFLIKNGTHIPSINNIYASSNWAEREIWDLMGLIFKNRPLCNRILTDYGFEGHPLRKDFPLVGFFEIYFNDSIAHCVREPVEFTQESRFVPKFKHARSKSKRFFTTKS